MQTNTITATNKKTTPHDTPIAILPPFDRPPFFQNMGQSGKEGTPHKPLLPERLQIDYKIKSVVNKIQVNSQSTMKSNENKATLW